MKRGFKWFELRFVGSSATLTWLLLGGTRVTTRPPVRNENQDFGVGYSYTHNDPRSILIKTKMVTTINQATSNIYSNFYTYLTWDSGMVGDNVIDFRTLHWVEAAHFRRLGFIPVWRNPAIIGINFFNKICRIALICINISSLDWFELLFILVVNRLTG
jgi:hypothetical protein